MVLDFVLATLATWRVAYFVSREDGPWQLGARLRSIGGRGASCLYCVSVWVAAPLSLLVAGVTGRTLLVWVAISGAACLLDRATERGLDVMPLDESGG
jgi:hypothetical protein